MKIKIINLYNNYKSIHWMVLSCAIQDLVLEEIVVTTKAC